MTEPTYVFCVTCGEYFDENNTGQTDGKFSECQPCTDKRDALRYRYLRERDLDTISKGGIFAGSTPDNMILNGIDLDCAVDRAIREQ